MAQSKNAKVTNTGSGPQTGVIKKTKKPILAIVLGITSGIVLAFSLVYIIDKSSANKGIEDSPKENLANILAANPPAKKYPGNYLEANLPKYPKADVYDLNSKNDLKSTLYEDSAQIILTTNDAPTTILYNLDKMLVKTGWSRLAPIQTEDSKQTYYVFERKNEKYSFIIKKDGVRSAVTINWQKNREGDSL